MQDDRTHLSDRLGDSKDDLDGSMALLKVALYPSASVMALTRRGGGKEHCAGSNDAAECHCNGAAECHRNGAAECHRNGAAECHRNGAAECHHNGDTDIY